MKKLILLPVMLWLCGCNMLEWPAYVLFGKKNETVQAEYTGLKGKKTAILVSSGPGINYEYPYARTNIALAVAQMTEKHVKKVEFIEQEKVETYQLENLDWVARPKTSVAAELDAERIIYLDLYQYTMTEPGSVNLLQGQIRAGVSIYAADAEKPNLPVYTTEVGVSWPEHGAEPAGGEALSRIQLQSIVRFADALSKKFYDHQVPAK